MRFLKNNRGGVLLEFVLAIPFFIMLIYYSFDAPMHDMFHRRVKYVTYYMASMFQSISKHRYNKELTKLDISRIISVSAYTLFNGMRAYIGSSKYSLLTYVYYITRDNDGLIKCRWFADRGGYDNPDSRNDSAQFILTSDNHISNVRFRETYLASDIHKDLKIENNQNKVIIDSMISTGGIYKIEFILSYPQHANSSTTFFNEITIFSPRYGVFSENVPI